MYDGGEQIILINNYNETICLQDLLNRSLNQKSTISEFSRSGLHHRGHRRGIVFNCSYENYTESQYT